MVTSSSRAKSFITLLRRRLQSRPQIRQLMRKLRKRLASPVAIAKNIPLPRFSEINKDIPVFPR